jgi:hypothetical protein
VSNGKFNPLPQTEEQRAVEACIKAMAADCSRQHGMSRRRVLASSAVMAAAFLAMNNVFGPVFSVNRAEAQTPGAAAPATSHSQSIGVNGPAGSGTALTVGRTTYVYGSSVGYLGSISRYSSLPCHSRCAHRLPARLPLLREERNASSDFMIAHASGSPCFCWRSVQIR